MTEQNQPDTTSLHEELADCLNKGTFRHWILQHIPTLANEIQHYLPQADTVQTEQFAYQVLRLRGLHHFFESYATEQNDTWDTMLQKAGKELDYQRTYRMALFGDGGAGKSLLINALLGRNLLPSGEGFAVTGTIVEIVFTSPDEQEEASVVLRGAEEITRLIEEFIKAYQLKPRNFPAPLDENLSREIVTWKLNPELAKVEGLKDDFEQVRTTLATMVYHFANGQSYSLKQTFSLADDKDLRQLRDLIDDKSTLNKDRKIDLLDRVVYRINPAPESEKAQRPLTLPDNVCLVDLPGVGGPKMHDLLIRRGIEEADVLVFIVAWPRVLFSNRMSLVRCVQEYFGLEGGSDAAERNFFVLNRWDAVKDPEQWDEIMHELMRMASLDYATRPTLTKRGGDQPYFKVSALMAYLAQRALVTGKLERWEGKDYKADYEAFAASHGLEIKNHAAMLQASNVPLLAEKLMEFVRDRRIGRQIDEGRGWIDRVIQGLIETYTTQLRVELKARDIDYVFKQGIPQLDDLISLIKEKDMSRATALLDDHEWQAVDLVTRHLRGTHFKDLDWLQGILQAEVDTITTHLNTALLIKMMEFWDRSSVSGYDRADASIVAQRLDQVLLGNVEAFMWDELTRHLRSLVEPLIHAYEEVLKTSDVRNQLARLGMMQQPHVATMLETIDRLLETMRHNLVQFSERIALVYVLDPSGRISNRYILSRHSQDVAQKALEEKRLLATLPQKPTRPEDFKPFVTAVLQKYEPSLKQWSVQALLHVYYYELICMEDGLVTGLKNLFTRLRSMAVTDPAFRKQVLSIDAGWEKVHTLIESLRVLAQLYPGR